MRTWGGKRKGAGRKRSKKRSDPDHSARPHHVRRFPVHVVLRTLEDVPRLRTLNCLRAIRHAMTRTCGKAGFRIVHVSVQHNHIHLIIEAEDEEVLARGIQGLTIAMARAINKACGRTGKVFEYRYHSTEIRTRRQARNALAYVLNNWRHHKEDLVSSITRSAALDPYSSAITFTGWKIATPFVIPADYVPLPVEQPETWLLAKGWQMYGLIDPTEVPGGGFE